MEVAQLPFFGGPSIRGPDAIMPQAKVWCTVSLEKLLPVEKGAIIEAYPSP
jgi:hypothetical protein